MRLLQKNKTTNTLKKIEIASLPFAFYWIYWFSPHSINLGGQRKIKRSRCLPAAAEFAPCGLSSCSFTYWKQLKPLLLLRSEDPRSRDPSVEGHISRFFAVGRNSAYNICICTVTGVPSQTVRELWLFKWTSSPTSCWKVETDSAPRIEVSLWYGRGCGFYIVFFSSQFWFTSLGFLLR